ncbi:MAG: 50S ribosomal protein L23 [Nitrososphaeria archaeon]|jgi:large subunit ribosomal protein L23
MDINDAYRIIKGIVKTEKTVNMITSENKLTFLVDEKANKHQIKEAVELLYGVKVVKVNTLIGKQGKKAYVKLDPSFKATELASKLGVM